MFRQTLVHEAPDGALVTYMARAEVAGTMMVDRRAVLEHDSPVVWFTFPDAHHDIGRFHTPDGAFTGLYANILTPVEIVPRWPDGDADLWRTTDLFLDLFMTPAGAIHVLDRDELRTAVLKGHLPEDLAQRAEEEADRLARLAQAGSWPPAIVHEWPLDRARAASDDAPDAPSRGNRSGPGEAGGRAGPRP